MKKFFTIIIVLLIVVVGGTLIFINPILERTKPSLLASIQSTLGVPLDIANIEVSIFPSPGFTLKGIKTGEGKLENRIEEAKLLVSLPSLLSGKVEIASFSMTGGSLKAIKTKDGKFIFLKESKEESRPVTESQPPKVESTQNESTPKQSKLPIKISDAKIDKIAFEIFDELNQDTLKIDNLEANASEDGTDTFINSKILAGNDEVNISAKLLESDLDRVMADVEFSIVDMNRWINTFVKDPLPAKLEGGLSGKLKFKKEASINTLSEIKLNLKSLGIKFQEFLDKKLGEKLDISLASLDLGADIVVGNLEIQLNGADFRADQISFNPTQKTIKQKALKSSLNLDDLKSSVPILNQYAISGKVDLQGMPDESLGIDFDGKYDSAKFELKGSLNDFGGAIATIKDRPFKFNFKLSESQIADLLKLAGKEKEFSYAGSLAETSCDLQRTTSAGLIDVQCKGGESNINATKLVLSNIVVKLHQKVAGNDLEASPVSMKVGAGGNIGLSYKQSSVGSKEINLSIETAQLKDLLSLAPSESLQKMPLTGILSKASVRLAGESTLNGPFDASFTDFTIVGFNLFKRVASALDKIPGMKEALTTSLPDSYKVILLADNSNFSTASLKGALSGSNVDIQTLVAQSKGYHIEGKGGVRAGALDFDLDLVIEKDLVAILETRSKEITKIKSLDGTILIPVTISKSKDGTPLVYPNLEKLLRSQATAQVREQGKKVLDKVVPGLGGIVDGFLGN